MVDCEKLVDYTPWLLSGGSELVGCTPSTGEIPERSAEEPASAWASYIVLASYVVLANYDVLTSCVGNTAAPVASPASCSGNFVAEKVSQAGIPDTYIAAGASQAGEPHAGAERASVRGSC